MKTLITPHINSIVSDFRIKGQVIKNRWHLHIPIGIASWILVYYLSTFVFRNEEPFWFQLFVVSFFHFAGCLGWEACQQGKRIIGSKERFESNKDALISTPIIQLLTLVLLLTQKRK